jgi:hemolysin activation/secretion protein
MNTLIPRACRIAVLLAVIPPCAHAQTPPDAGALQQQIERERSQQLPRRMAPEKPSMPTEMQPSGITVTVREFRFVGNTLIPAERLASVVAAYMNRPLDFNQLQSAAAAVADAYREAGWIVRAYLPQQDIRNGIVTIQIVEAVFGKLVPEGVPSRLPLSSALARFEARQKPEEPLNADALDRALLLVDDLPGVAVAGTLLPGTKDGETDVVLKFADEPLIVGEMGADNVGSRSTGSQRITANMSVNSPLNQGEQFVANFIHARGNDYARLAWSLPVGNDGWRMGVNASRLDYRLVASEFKRLDGAGDSTSFGVEASYPIIRMRLKNLFLNFAIDRKDFDNRTATGTTSRYRIDNATVSLAGNLFDQWGGGGANSASVAFTQGKIDLGDLDPGELASLGGSYSKLRYSVTRQQVISPVLSLFAAWSGQWAKDNLDSAEKFYLGGAYGVRAYPANEGGGGRGQLLNLEIRWKLPEGFTATAFYDWGRTIQNIDNRVLASSPNRYQLRGHGLSLAWQTASGFSLKATWARRDGDNPNPSARGYDQDGSLEKNRWWLTASLPF